MSKNAKVALCCICKMENEYIREYVQYYRDLGFAKIFLYDNNDIDGEVLSEPIQDYINEGFVEVIDVRGLKLHQLRAYEDCYNNRCNDYDWVAFFDIDEFLAFNDSAMTLEKWITDARFDDTNIIHVNWLIFGNDGQLSKKDGLVQERFKKPMILLDKCIAYDNIPENCHAKSIVRCNVLKNVRWVNTHTLLGYNMVCRRADYGNGNSSSPFEPINYSVAYLKHYVTKSLEEYISKFLQRGYGDIMLKDEDKQLHNILVKFEKYNG